MRNYLKTLLFLSAFSPALITLSYVRYDAHGLRTETTILATLGIIGFLSSTVIIKFLNKKCESFRVIVKKVESNDFMLVVFVASYLTPLVVKCADISFNKIMAILSIIALLFWLTNSLPAHPLLRLFRFRFYKVELFNGMVYTLISKREIRDPSQITLVKKVSETMLVENECSI